MTSSNYPNILPIYVPTDRPRLRPWCEFMGLSDYTAPQISSAVMTIPGGLIVMGPLTMILVSMPLPIRR